MKVKFGILRDGQVPCGRAADNRIGNNGNDLGERRAFVSTRGRCGELERRHTEEVIAVQVDDGRILHDGGCGWTVRKVGLQQEQ